MPGGLHRERDPMQTGKVNSLKNQAKTDNPGCLILERKFQGGCFAYRSCSRPPFFFRNLWALASDFHLFLLISTLFNSCWLTSHQLRLFNFFSQPSRSDSVANFFVRLSWIAFFSCGIIFVLCTVISYTYWTVTMNVSRTAARSSQGTWQPDHLYAVSNRTS